MLPNARSQLMTRAMRPAANLFLGERGNPALDLI
jgi:hypothetical protein